MHQTNVITFVSYTNVTDNTVKYSNLEDPYPVYVLAIITVIYSVIFVIGLVGNVITCIVIISNKSMHTVANCYLFNLATSDLLLLLSGLPFDIITSWDPYKYDFGKVGCFMRGWLSETSADVSILTITAFTFERYLAVCRPITAQVMSKISRAIRLIIVIWMVSFLCGAVIAYQSKDLVMDDAYKCSFLLIIPYSLDMMALLFFVIPLAIITILYILIGRSLKKSEKMKGCRTYNPDRYSNNILKMLVSKSWYPCSCYHLVCSTICFKNSRLLIIVSIQKCCTPRSLVIVVVFFISWAPFQLQRMISVHAAELVSTKVEARILLSVTDGLYYISGIFYFFSGAINPIIYNIMSNKFREAFKETISKCWVCRKKESLSLSPI